MKERDKLAGIIEDSVRDSRLVDKGLQKLDKRAVNAPTFEVDRRSFLNYLAMLTGILVAERYLKGNANAGESWETWLMSQDLIRGPSLMIHPFTGLPADFEHHRNQPINQGYGAVDYDVPIGTPVTPVARGRVFQTGTTPNGADILTIWHARSIEDRRPAFRSSYLHLSKFVKTYSDLVNIDTITAISGNTGRGPPPSGYQPPHLDLRIAKMEDAGPSSKGEGFRTYKSPLPGLDPFTLGIDGGRPVYWDGKTKIIKDINLINKKAGLEQFLDTLGSRLKDSDLDKETVKELLDRYNKPDELKEYIGMRVLQKKKGQNGAARYEFMPGSLMYSLMLELYIRTSKQEFIAMLPFIFPPLKETYQKANPNIQF